MAGPRAPIGTLSQHAAAAAGLVRGMVPAMFTRTDPKRARKAEVSESESESESDSDSSNSDTEETNESTRQDTKNWAEKMKAKKVTSTPTSAGKPIKANAASSAAKADIKKRPASESSASESDDSSDDEADKMAVDPNSESETESKNNKSASAKGKKEVKEEADSDSESESSDEEMADAKPTKDAPSTSASEASAGEDESSDEESAPAAKPTLKAAAKSTGEESASESESDSEDEQAPAAKGKTAAQSESESESESEDEPEPPKKSKPAKEIASTKKTAPAKASKAPTAVNGDASDAESDSEEEDAAESMAVEKRSGKTAVQAPREIVSQGFHLRKAEEDVDAAAVARAFKKAKAEGKQIWYFTTPKSVPIEVIQKHAIPLDKVHAGKSIFAHEGADYTGQFEEPLNHAIKVLIPGKTGNYETLKQSVDRVLHITRVTRFGEETETELAAAAVTPPVVTKAPRPQPKGLKARYQAFGVPNGAGSVGIDASDNDEDVEMAQAPPLDAKSDKKAAKKRKHGDVEKTSNQDEAASTPIKKAKKARVDSSSTKAAKQTPIAPPPIPSAPTKAVAPSEPAQSSPKKSKGKGKSKKDSASAEKASDLKMPTKGAIQQGIRAASVPPDYQSMSEARKRREATQTSTPGTPGTPTKQRIASLTPVPIPGIYTPRKVFPTEPWTLKDPSNPARPNSTPITTPSQPLKSILKTPQKYSGGKGAHSGGQSKSGRKNKKKKQGTPSVFWTGDTKRGHGAS